MCSCSCWLLPATSVSGTETKLCLFTVELSWLAGRQYQGSYNPSFCDWDPIWVETILQTLALYLGLTRHLQTGDKLKEKSVSIKSWATKSQQSSFHMLKRFSFIWSFDDRSSICLIWWLWRQKHVSHIIFIPIRPFSDPLCPIDGGIVILFLHSGFSFILSSVCIRCNGLSTKNIKQQAVFYLLLSTWLQKSFSLEKKKF